MDQSETHHLLHVVRAKAGEKISVFDGQGTEFSAAIISASPRGALIELLEPIENPVESPLVTVLWAGLTREQAWDAILQQSVQLGISAIGPLITQRSERRKGKYPAERWQRILIAAAKQCGRRVLPRIFEPAALEDLPRMPPNTLRLRLAPGASCHFKHGQLRERIELAAGPEGGFSENDEIVLDQKGFLPLGLGPRILKAEMAAAAALTLIQYHFGDWAPSEARDLSGEES